MNYPTHQLDIELCPDNLADGLRALLHSILFLRAVGKVSHPRRGQCKSFPTLCYAKLPGLDLPVERALSDLFQQINFAQRRSSFTLALSFYQDDKRKSSSSSGGGEKVYLERFHITVRLQAGGEDDARREEQVLRKAILRTATLGNVKLLPYSMRTGDHPLFEITLHQSTTFSRTAEQQQHKLSSASSWFGMFGYT